MSLKNNKALKYFALLLFTFELLSPVLLFSSVQSSEESNPKIGLHTSSRSINLLTVLLCEEPGNEEEREGKEHKSVSPALEPGLGQFCYIPRPFVSITATFSLFDFDLSEQALFILHRNYRI